MVSYNRLPASNKHLRSQSNTIIIQSFRGDINRRSPTTPGEHNLLTRGQEVMVKIDHSRRRVITLRPGEMSLHHVRLVHGSPPNPSNDRRIGFAIRYIPTDVAQLAGEDSATVVRGEDRHHHFMSEPQPSRDLDPEFVALHRTITECRARILYRGTEIASYNEPKALAQRG